MGLKVRGHSVPDKWAKCSTDTFQRIVLEWEPEKPITERDRVKLYAILCDQPYDSLYKSTDKTLEALLWEASRFVYEESSDWTKSPIPPHLEYQGRYIPIPRDLGKLTIGQNIHVRQAVNMGKDPNSLISLIVAVYLQPFIDSVIVNGEPVKVEFNFERALEVEKSIKQMPITVTYPIGFFFFKRLRPFGSGFLWSLRLRIQKIIRGVRLLLVSPKGQSLTEILKRVS